jgi:hypothetical protein
MHSLFSSIFTALISFVAARNNKGFQNYAAVFLSEHGWLVRASTEPLEFDNCNNVKSANE